MFDPQLHTNTPIRGSSPDTFRSGGNCICLDVLYRTSESLLAAVVAAAEACTTERGISIGPTNAPQAKIPGRDVETGEKQEVAAKPSGVSSIPVLFARAAASKGGSIPTDRTTRSKFSFICLPLSATKRRLMSSLESPGSTAWMRHL